jgi:hypothetical protein
MVVFGRSSGKPIARRIVTRVLRVLAVDMARGRMGFQNGIED